MPRDAITPVVPEVPSSLLAYRAAKLDEQRKLQQQMSIEQSDELNEVAYQFSSLNRAARAKVATKNSNRQEAESRSATKGNASETSSLAHLENLPEERAVRVLVKSSVPIGGKTAFALEHLMSNNLQTIYDTIVRRFGSPLGTMTLHRSDTGAKLELGKTFLEQGFRFPPLLLLKGFTHEYYLTNVGVPAKMTVPWNAHLTVTDLVQAVYTRQCPYDLRLMRVSVTNVVVGQEQATTRFLDVARCFLYDDDASLDERRTLCELKLAQSDDDAVVAHFLRTKEGKPIEFDITQIAFGSTTVQDVKDAVLSWDAATIGHRLTAPIDEETLLLIHNDCPYDDEDEEIAPAGNKRVYYHGCKPFPTFSFNPPQECSLRPEPRFIPLEQDFAVQHLTDAGVYPGTEVVVEYFNPHTGVWSGETTSALAAAAVVPSAESPPRHFADKNNDVTDLLTIRCSRGQIVRLPVHAHTNFDSVLHRLWCATGDLPMFTVLRTDGGRLLNVWETLSSVSLLPQTTVFAVRRPRPWFGESHEKLASDSSSQPLAANPEPDVARPSLGKFR